MPGSAAFIMLASPQAMSRKRNGEVNTSFRVSVQDAADFAVGHAIAFDQLAIGGPLCWNCASAAASTTAPPGWN